MEHKARTRPAAGLDCPLKRKFQCGCRIPSMGTLPVGASQYFVIWIET